MDAVRASDHDSVLMFARLTDDGFGQSIKLTQQNLGGTQKLQSQRRVNDIRAGQTHMDEASRLTDVLGYIG
ncbi:MAG: hypothetical protein BWY75_03606 [bacterium ADurb.Bin425]|nr:MAG: hypothetical protein BWY75_03606 [bacterium ADurb.Bin425]